MGEGEELSREGQGREANNAFQVVEGGKYSLAENTRSLSPGNRLTPLHISTLYSRNHDEGEDQTQDETPCSIFPCTLSLSQSVRSVSPSAPYHAMHARPAIR